MDSPTRWLISLSDVLATIPDNPWTWTVRDFRGAGVVPGGMPGFRARVLAEGVPFTWAELRAFAERQGQTIDCLIVAEWRGERVAEVEAFDSATWHVRMPERWERTAELLDELRG